MKPRYIEPISIKFARQFLQLYVERARIPHGSRCYWIAGVHAVTDTPGVYLIATDTGLVGVWVQAAVAKGAAA